MPLTPKEEAQLALLEKKRGRNVVSLVPNQAPTSTVHDKLREALSRADEFEEIIIITRPKVGDQCTAFCSCFPPTGTMIGVAFRTLVKL